MYIGSAGESFTTVAVMQLVEAGLIELGADVTTYLDFDIPATYPQPLTIRHLLTHISGFEARDMGVILLDSNALPTILDYLIGNLPDRVRRPGEATGYSNYGLALLGYVVERVSGMSLSGCLESSIIAPLGQDLLVFHRDETGQVTGDSLNSRPVFTLERHSWYEAPSITFAALIGTNRVFLAGLIINGIHLWLTRAAIFQQALLLGKRV